MRSILYFFAAVTIVGLAYWAYNENYETQAAIGRVDDLQQQIGTMQENLGVLKAEWAYLNRPDRLRELTDLNFDALRLMPLAPESFGAVEQVAFPSLDVNDVKAPVDVSAADPAQNGGVSP
ncbi:MAG: cell division protein FtsL [Alphaproteobacteria bacterium]|nr:cell division protein FtsL [Alphaproteobacteria bacterium]